MVFTRQFSAFDRQNQAAANNTFHGFYTLFWIALVFLLVKMGAENWRKTGRIDTLAAGPSAPGAAPAVHGLTQGVTGSPLGSNEIMKIMFGRDGESPW